ncbi:MAG: hypothetical protein MJB14_02950 [Spirochaetes bacterium]|nr:hypothetical protein [Spirochaetota bacterium]
MITLETKTNEDNQYLLPVIGRYINTVNRRQIKKDKKNQKQSPYLFIKTETENPAEQNLIKQFGYEKLKHIKLPEIILELELHQQLKIIKKIIHTNYEELKGRIAFFGKITGYIYHRSTEEHPFEHLIFQPNGEVALNEMTLYTAKLVM